MNVFSYNFKVQLSILTLVITQLCKIILCSNSINCNNFWHARPNIYKEVYEELDIKEVGKDKYY